MHLTCPLLIVVLPEHTIGNGHGVELPHVGVHKPATSSTVPVALTGETVTVKFIGWPEMEGLGLDVRVVLVPVSATGGELLPLYMLLPPYVAVTLWLPLLKATVMLTHCPLPLVQVGWEYKVAEPIVAPLSKNVTVPGAFEGETMAVRISPPGVGAKWIVVVVFVLLLTIWDKTADVLLL